MNEGFLDQVKNFCRTNLAVTVMVALTLGWFFGYISVTGRYDKLRLINEDTITRQQTDLKDERAIIRDQLATIQSLGRSLAETNRPATAVAPFSPACPAGGDETSSDHHYGRVDCLSAFQVSFENPRGQWKTETLHLHLVRTP